MVLASLPWAKPSVVLDALMAPEAARDAACRDLEPEEADAMFFPQRGHSADRWRALCASCPVKSECLELALENREEFGIWGGTSERQRRALKAAGAARRHKRKSHSPAPTGGPAPSRMACASCTTA